jgi:broad specificity phosphatase PhoE
VTDLLLVRHGQSEWNAVGRWQGQADPPLTELGRAQARHAAVHLPDFDLLASSTLVRAATTADEIADVVGMSDIVRDADLVERDAGGFSGLTRAEIDERYPGYLDAGRWPEGWEHDEVMVVRLAAAIERLRATGAQTIVAVSHGGVIYALEAALGAEFERVANLGGRWFHFDADAVADNGVGAAGNGVGAAGSSLASESGSGRGLRSGWRLGERVHLLGADEETVPDQL